MPLQNDYFRRFAVAASRALGSPKAFIAAFLIILTWAICGPIFNFSTTWQLFINTGTTITTFLMIFLVQNTQNRDSKAIHIKLDELLRGVKGARTSLVDLENLPDKEIEVLSEEFKKIHEQYRLELKKRGKDLPN